MRDLSTLAIVSLIGLSACGGDGTSAVSLDQVGGSVGSRTNGTSIPSSCVSSATPFGSGSGTANDPYTICTVAQFAAIGPNDTSHFLITTDLDFSSMGTPLSALSGTLDGGGHTMTHVHQYNINMNNVGWIAENSGTIKNLTLSGVAIYGTQNVGGVAGVNDGIIDQITISGSVPSSNAGNNVGGIAGVNRGTISNSFTDLSVVGNNGVGGIAGDFQGGVVSNTTASGSVTAQFQVGGGFGVVDSKLNDGGTGIGVITNLTIQSTVSSGNHSQFGCMEGYLVPANTTFTGNSC